MRRLRAEEARGPVQELADLAGRLDADGAAACYDDARRFGEGGLEVVEGGREGGGGGVLRELGCGGLGAGGDDEGVVGDAGGAAVGEGDGGGAGGGGERRRRALDEGEAAFRIGGEGRRDRVQVFSRRHERFGHGSPGARDAPVELGGGVDERYGVGCAAGCGQRGEDVFEDVVGGTQTGEGGAEDEDGFLRHCGCGGRGLDGRLEGEVG